MPTVDVDIPARPQFSSLPPLRKISVVIPAFNAERFLRDTVQSSLGQHQELEIVIVDDGSVDNTLKIARSFEPEITVLSGPNRGVSSARNRGVAEVMGEWIQFVDSDDLLASGTLEQRLAVAGMTSADVVVTDWAEFEMDSDLSTDRIRPRVADWEKLERDGAEFACATSFWAPPAAILYRRSVVDSIGGFREDLPVIQDARFLFDAAYHGAKIVHAPHLGAYYRVQPSSLSRRDPARFWLDVLLNGEQIEALWRESGALSEKQKTALAGMFDGCARVLLKAGTPEWRRAAHGVRRVGRRHTRQIAVASCLSRFFGDDVARHVVRLLSK